MQAKNGSLVASIWAVGLILLMAIGYNISIQPEIQEVPTAAEIAALVNVSVPVVDNSDVLADILDQVDTRTDVSSTDKNNAIDYADDELSSRDLKDLVADLIDMDDDDFTIISTTTKDTEVTTASEDDNDDGNFKVCKYIRVVYHDDDEDAGDNDVIYVLLTADVTDLYDDANDQDVDFSAIEVTRSFEFD